MMDTTHHGGPNMEQLCIHETKQHLNICEELRQKEERIRIWELWQEQFNIDVEFESV